MPTLNSPARLRSKEMGYTATGSSWTMTDERKFIDGLGEHTPKSRLNKLTRQDLLERYVEYMMHTRVNYDRLDPAAMIGYARRAING